MAENMHNFIEIHHDRIRYGFHARHITESDGNMSWYIPSFDIYFSSPNKEEGDKRAKAITKSFMNYWINQKGFRSFVLQILKLGFKTSTHVEFQNLLTRKNINARLKAPIRNMPKAFENSETSDQENELLMAV